MLRQEFSVIFRWMCSLELQSKIRRADLFFRIWDVLCHSDPVSPNEYHLLKMYYFIENYGTIKALVCSSTLLEKLSVSYSQYDS